MHKKIDEILQKLVMLEANDKGLAKQDSARQHQESQTLLHDMGQMLLEVRKSPARTEERVAEILAETC